MQIYTALFSIQSTCFVWGMGCLVGKEGCLWVGEGRLVGAGVFCWERRVFVGGRWMFSGSRGV